MTEHFDAIETAGNRSSGTVAMERKLPLTVLEGDVSDPDAVAIGVLYRKVESSIVESVRLAIEIGQRFLEKKDALGHGAWLRWLKANADVLGMNVKSTPQRLMKLARKFGVNAEFDAETALQISREVWGNNIRGTGGTGNDEWHTPPRFLEPVRRVLGTIDLDPASSDAAQLTVRAVKYFTKEDDGLEHDWDGHVWLNPPYSQPLIAEFIDKLIAECNSGRVREAILLTHNYTHAKWFEVAARYATSICFTACPRIKFIDPDGDEANPTQGQAFCYFGDNPQLFEDVFCVIGHCFRLSRQYEANHR
jgi:phage N-6-adenine-methyltransferase